MPCGGVLADHAPQSRDGHPVWHHPGSRLLRREPAGAIRRVELMQGAFASASFEYLGQKTANVLNESTAAKVTIPQTLANAFHLVNDNCLIAPVGSKFINL